MSPIDNTPHLPPTFNRLAWSNLAAQSAEQIALAAAPIVAVPLLGIGEGQNRLLQKALTLPFGRDHDPGWPTHRPHLATLSDDGCGSAARHGPVRDPNSGGAGWLTLRLLAVLGFVAACGTVTYSVAPALVPL